jgi:hypothetical protein
MLVNVIQNCIHLTYHYYSFHDTPASRHMDQDVCAAPTTLSYIESIDDWQIIINLEIVLCIHMST